MGLKETLTLTICLMITQSDLAVCYPGDPGRQHFRVTGYPISCNDWFVYTNVYYYADVESDLRLLLSDRAFHIGPCFLSVCF